MIKLKVISVGRDRSGLFEPAVQEYAARIRHTVPLDLVELKAASGPHAKRNEGSAILERCGKARLVALDQRGRQFASEEWATFLARARQEARDTVFAIGGDEGLADDVLQKASLVFSLGKMTLPHRLARVVLLEQIYRALTIVRGEPYHK